MDAPLNDIASAIRESADALSPALVALRRDLHAHPELAFHEHRTAGIVARELARLGIPHRTGVGGTGVIGTIEGGRPGPVIAIRADMDALPIEERTGLAFASESPGVMHACGHDVHTSTLLGVAAILLRLAPSLAGSVRLIFQPAEEVLGGATAMIAEGALDGVEVALGFHNHPEIPVGRFGYVRGPTYAACDEFRVTLHGRSGHAAYPHGAIDPIVAAAQLLLSLQTVVSREIGPLDPCVVTVGAIHAGTVSNIIPDRCELLGTVRTLSLESRAAARAAVERQVEGIGVLTRVRAALAWGAGVPPTMNDPAVLEGAIAAIAAQQGDVLDEQRASMGAEDFAHFALAVPSFNLRIGSGAPGRDDHLHNSEYQPDEACIRIGAAALARAAAELLRMR